MKWNPPNTNTNKNMRFKNPGTFSNKGSGMDVKYIIKIENSNEYIAGTIDSNLFKMTKFTLTETAPSHAERKIINVGS